MSAATLAASTSEPGPRSPVLRVEGLRVVLASGPDVVTDIAFELAAGEILGLVGESGSGKTTIASALLGYARRGARIAGGRVLIAGSDVLRCSKNELTRLRGRVISYVSQDPGTALNPVRRIGTQLREVLTVHQPSLDSSALEQQLGATLADVGLSADREFLERFPHQLSGGQQQRVVLALAFLLKPKLVVLDEPTTALDVTTQAKVLDAVRRLCARSGAAAIYVSHDLGVVSRLADRVLVLYAGQIVESGPRELFAAPAHPYTRGLLDALPSLREPRRLRAIPGQPVALGRRPAGCAFAPRCARRSDACSLTPAPWAELRFGHHAACWHPLLPVEQTASADAPSGARDESASASPELLKIQGVSASYGARQVLFDVGFEVAAGECVALVGESGCGKTTLARALVGLGERARGSLLFEGKPLPFSARARDAETRRKIQYVFQNPQRALNPKHTVSHILSAALRHFFPLSPPEVEQRLRAALARVALGPEVAAAYPRELSGGERQRVAIARALVCEPRLLISDEITSSLDASVQATILVLLRELKRDGLAILLVTHDLGVVRAVADRVVVMHGGRTLEIGRTDDVLQRPRAPYTRQLIENSPTLA